MNTKAKKIRLSLDVSAETNEVLEDLARTICGTKSEVLRKSIALIDIAVQAKKNGQKLGVANKDQPLAFEIVGL